MQCHLRHIRNVFRKQSIVDSQIIAFDSLDFVFFFSLFGPNLIQSHSLNHRLIEIIYLCTLHRLAQVAAGAVNRVALIVASESFDIC